MPRLKAYDEAVTELRSNVDQWSAFESTGHCAMLAGPGSGKTKVLTTKMARTILEDVREPRGVACVTYNNECVRELERRLAKLGVEDRSNVFVGTLHAFCLRFILRPLAQHVGVDVPHPISVASEAAQRRVFDKAMKEVGIRAATADLRMSFDRFRRTAIDRVTGVDGWEPGDRGLTDLCFAYERMLRIEGLVDFDDIILLSVRAVDRSNIARRCMGARFKMLFVDEYQDLGVPLHRLVQALCFKGDVRLFAVGDPDQSIYGFTGARPELLRELSGRGGVERVELCTNYRSGRRIVEASCLALGIEREFYANSNEEGSVNFKHCPAGLNAQVEHAVQVLIPKMLGDGERPGQIALLYPTHQEGNALERGLLDASIPFVRLDRGAGYRRTPIIRFVEDLAAWCCGGWSEGNPPLSKLLTKWRSFLPGVAEPEAREARVALVKFAFAARNSAGPTGAWLRRLESDVLSARIESLETDEREAFGDLLRACSVGGDLAELDIGMFAGKSGSLSHIVLMNLHTSKGTEFNNVILVGMDSGRMPVYHAKTPETLAEQRRLFFVGVSRARHQVHMLYSGWTINGYGRRFDDGPSPYLVELQRKLKLAASSSTDGAPAAPRRVRTGKGPIVR